MSAPHPSASPLAAPADLPRVEADEPITPDWLTTGKWEVQVANTLVPAKVSLYPLYDPKSERIKG